MSFININIIDSFNKKGDSNKEEGEVSNSSTLNNNKNIIETTSISTDSLTNDQKSGSIFIPKANKSIIKEIVISVISIVLGAVISYFIFGIK